MIRNEKKLIPKLSLREHKKRMEYDFSTLLYDIVNMISMKAKDKGLEVLFQCGAGNC